MSTAATYDFDIHGIVGVRLTGPSAADLQVVRRQLGPLDRPLDRDPDIVIRFVERLPRRMSPRLLGAGEAAFTDDGFLVLRSRHKTTARVQIPFEDIGRRCEIVCERGGIAVPLLIPIVNLTALAHGVIPLHASAFLYEGTGVVCTGWSKGGKTETLLAFLSEGAEYIGDEWVYVDQHGQRVSGLPEPIRLWSFYLDQLPALRVRIGRAARGRLRRLRILAAIATRMARLGGHYATGGAMHRLAAGIRRQLHVDVPPEGLLAADRRKSSASFDHLLFVVSAELPEIRVAPCSPREVAKRMTFSLQAERSAFMNYYQMFRFAFPDRENALIDRANQLERELLSEALVGKPCHVVEHPYPAQIAELFETIKPWLKAPAGGAVTPAAAPCGVRGNPGEACASLSGARVSSGGSAEALQT